jgi:hypothetical protein
MVGGEDCLGVKARIKNMISTITDCKYSDKLDTNMGIIHDNDIHTRQNI